MYMEVIMERGRPNRKSGKQNDFAPKDKLFDPSVDMLVNDFDDERTLEEEEALAEAEDPEVELSSLQKESNMPLEELLALYGYCNENKENNVSPEVSRATSSLEVPATVEDSSPPSPEEPSKLKMLYEPMADSEDTKVPKSTHVGDEEDYDYNPEEDELRKTIMVGSDYQAKVSKQLVSYDEEPYTQEDVLIWNPSLMDQGKIESYLEKVYVLKKPPLPTGTQLRDDEEALYLLHQCEYNTEEALRKLDATLQGNTRETVVESPSNM